MLTAGMRLIETRTRSPVVADIKETCDLVIVDRAAEHGRQEAQEYVSYHDRPEWERREIDAARSEFFRVWKALEAGADVETLFPPDSEPVRLKHKMSRLRAGMES